MDEAQSGSAGALQIVHMLSVHVFLQVESAHSAYVHFQPLIRQNLSQL